MSSLKQGTPLFMHRPHDCEALAAVFHETDPLQLMHHCAYESCSMPAFVHFAAHTAEAVPFRAFLYEVDWHVQQVLLALVRTREELSQADAQSSASSTVLYVTEDGAESQLTHL